MSRAADEAHDLVVQVLASSAKYAREVMTECFLKGDASGADAARSVALHLAHAIEDEADIWQRWNEWMAEQKAARRKKKRR